MARQRVLGDADDRATGDLETDGLLRAPLPSRTAERPRGAPRGGRGRRGQHNPALLLHHGSGRETRDGPSSHPVDHHRCADLYRVLPAHRWRRAQQRLSHPGAIDVSRGHRAKPPRRRRRDRGPPRDCSNGVGALQPLRTREGLSMDAAVGERTEAGNASPESRPSGGSFLSSRVLLLTALVVVAFIFLFPFYYMLLGAIQRDQSFGLSGAVPVSYTHLRAHETDSYLVCRLLL